MASEGLTGFVKGLADAFKPGKARFDNTDEPEVFTSGTETAVDRLADWLPYSGWLPRASALHPGLSTGQAIGS